MNGYSLKPRPEFMPEDKYLYMLVYEVIHEDIY